MIFFIFLQYYDKNITQLTSAHKIQDIHCLPEVPLHDRFWPSDPVLYRLPKFAVHMLKPCSIQFIHLAYIYRNQLIYQWQTNVKVQEYKLSDIDECTSAPCMNGGACDDEVNGYVCECNAGYTGNECETGK